MIVHYVASGVTAVGLDYLVNDEGWTFVHVLSTLDIWPVQMTVLLRKTVPDVTEAKPQPVKRGRPRNDAKQ